MAIDFADILAEKADATVSYRGQSMRVSYFPDVITTAAIKELESKSQEDPAAFLEFLVRLLDSWDVKAGGKPIPLTVEGLEQLPLLFLKEIYFQIMESSGSGDEGKA